MQFIPVELRELVQWLVWRYEQTDRDKPTKVPYNACAPRQHAATDNPATWATCEEALATMQSDGFSGIGFVFSENDPYVGIDLDNCRDPETGRIEPWAEIEIAAFGSYCELSPSGTGVHIIVQGKLPGNDGRKTTKGAAQATEIYNARRYFAFTGDHLDGSPFTIEERQAEIDAFLARRFPPDPVRTTPEARSTAKASVFDRARKYLDKVDPAISGQRGHDQTFKAASKLIEGFGLSIDDARPILKEYSLTCCPPWTDKQIEHKLEDAEKNADPSKRGYLLRSEFDPKPMNGNGHSRIEPTKQETDAARKLANTPVNGQSSKLVGDWIEGVISGKIEAIPWPWPIFSKMTKALFPKTVTIIAGMKGATKSFLLNQVFAEWHSKGYNVALLVLEDDREFTLRRMTAQREHQGGLLDDEWIRYFPEKARAAAVNQAAFLDAYGKCVTDVDRTMTLGEVAKWVDEKCKSGCRIIGVDPITAATTSDKRWLDDKEFINTIKHSAKQYECSIVLVNHLDEKTGAMRGGQDLANLAQTLVHIKAQEPEEIETYWASESGMSVVNRVLYFDKTRNGKGTGMRLGFFFDSETLEFKERGLIRKVKKKGSGKSWK